MGVQDARTRSNRQFAHYLRRCEFAARLGEADHAAGAACRRRSVESVDRASWLRSSSKSAACVTKWVEIS